MNRGAVFIKYSFSARLPSPRKEPVLRCVRWCQQSRLPQQRLVSISQAQLPRTHPIAFPRQRGCGHDTLTSSRRSLSLATIAPLNRH